LDGKNTHSQESQKRRPNLSKFFDILEIEVKNKNVDIEKKLIIEFCEHILTE